MTLSEIMKKYWYIPFTIFGILFLSYFVVGLVMQMNEPSYVLTVYELNDCDVIPFSGYFNEKGEVINTPRVIPFTDEDFEQFPKLASIIRDKSQKPVM